MDTFVHFGARCLPNRGKVLSQQGQAACPTWARFLLIFSYNSRQDVMCQNPV